jgi:hypothetical protein
MHSFLKDMESIPTSWLTHDVGMDGPLNVDHNNYLWNLTVDELPVVRSPYITFWLKPKHIAQAPYV